MDSALRTMREVGTSMDALSVVCKEVEEAHRLAEEREQLATDGVEEVPHFWNEAMQATRTAKNKLRRHAHLATGALQRAEISKRTALLKADDVVRLVNEKMQRWQ